MDNFLNKEIKLNIPKSIKKFLFPYIFLIIGLLITLAGSGLVAGLEVNFILAIIGIIIIFGTLACWSKKKRRLGLVKSPAIAIIFEIICLLIVTILFSPFFKKDILFIFENPILLFSYGGLLILVGLLMIFGYLFSGKNIKKETKEEIKKDAGLNQKKPKSYLPSLLKILLIILIVLLVSFYMWNNHKELKQQHQACLKKCSEEHQRIFTRESWERSQVCQAECDKEFKGLSRIIGIILPQKNYHLYISDSKPIFKATNGIISDVGIISFEKVNNLGYSFYLAQIDYINAPPISDGLKNNITQVIYRANFPKKLLNNVGIIIVNTLAVSEYKYIKTPDGEHVSLPDFSPSFMAGGGIYGKKIGKMSIIFINKTHLNDLSDILTHELGHHIGDQLTSSEWEKYYQLRRIPVTTSRRDPSWELSPEEDFAEVYKNIFTGLRVKTHYGLLKPRSAFFEYTCSKIYDRLMDNYKKAKYPNASPWNVPLFITEEEANITSNVELQNCRREVLSYPEKYPNDWSFGVPYQSEVDQATKDFVVSIIKRLNR